MISGMSQDFKKRLDYYLVIKRLASVAKACNQGDRLKLREP
jgi:hypothetical protein